MPIEAILGIGSSVIGAIGSNSAANQQQAAAAATQAFNERVYNNTRQDYKPTVQAGRTAQQIYDYEMFGGQRPMIGGKPLNIRSVERPVSGGGGLNGDINSLYGGNGFPTQGNTKTFYKVGDERFGNIDKARAYARENGRQGERYDGYQSTRDFKVGMRGGVNAIDASAANSGMLNSGRTAQALTRFGTDYAQQYRDNYLGKLGGMISNGINAIGNKATAGQNALASTTLNNSNYGDAGAAGTMGMVNSFQNGLGNAYGNWEYQNALTTGNGNVNGYAPTGGAR